MNNEPYLCRICGHWWRRVEAVLCGVMHAPGTCCHYGDKPEPAPAQTTGKEPK